MPVSAGRLDSNTDGQNDPESHLKLFFKTTTIFALAMIDQGEWKSGNTKPAT